MEVVVEQGRVYWPVEARENQKLELGMIAVDAFFSPVRSVYFDVSHVRVGQMTNFDKLELVLETDGTMTGQEAVDITAHILVDHFSMLFGEIMPTAEETKEGMRPELAPGPLTSLSGEPGMPGELPLAGSEIQASALSNRAKNALTKNGIAALGQLNAMSNQDIENLSGLGDKTVKEILEFLKR